MIITIFITYFVTMKSMNRRTQSQLDVMVVRPMLSTGGNNHHTYTLYTSPLGQLGVHALGLPLGSVQA